MGGCQPRSDLSFASHRARQSEITHQSGHPIAAHRDAFPEQLSPDLLDPVDAEVVAVDATDLLLQLPHPPRWGPPGFDGIVRESPQKDEDGVEGRQKSIRFDAGVRRSLIS